MKHSVLIAASLVALGLAGCGKKNEPSAEATSAMATEGIGTPSPSAAVSGSQAFANTAAASDKFEIETSKLAETKATSAKIKSFAEQMIKAHTQSTEKLKTAAAAAAPAIVPVPEFTATQQQTLNDLSTSSGAAFDTAYAKAQVEAHQTALNGLKSYAANGDVPQLRSFATGLIPTVTAHLNMAKGL